MSNTQYYMYIEMRNQEIDKEDKARMFGNNNDGGDRRKDEIKNGSAYRSFSRALCNFVFPEEITRPYPSTLKEFKMDVDEAKDDILVKKSEAIATEKSKRGKGAYEKAIAKALGQLTEEHLGAKGLRTFGPKMQAIIDNVNTSPGPALVYSVFRNVEGLKILSMAFDIQGYTELQVKKDMAGKWHMMCSDFSKPKYIVFTDRRDEVDILLNIFNSDFKELPPTLWKELQKMGIHDNIRGDFIRVLMITQSGSEGISLKNVRQAHVMEPYWNDIRVKQVFGRAVRANSHAALPKKERIVETFIYIMTLNEKQKNSNAIVMNRDQGTTSDGYIFDIAKRKASINDQFLQLLKNSSVDCMVNKAVHKTAVQCFKPPAQKDKSAPTYHLGSMTRDHAENKVKTEKVTVVVSREFKPMKKRHNGREIVLLMNPTADDQAVYERYAPSTSHDALWKGIYYKDDAELGTTFVLVGIYKEDQTTKKKGVIWVIKET
jgi:hypothetical protein